ncbi:MAG TPA: hypothetical protein VGR62_19465 [Candidatus Binatia bacterium]|jgi:hypothetical protein|nr:hypothetical protein [Candidatus Binatia bacterium]
MLTRLVLAAALLASTAYAGFDLDPRIRPRLDGRYVLPAPFDQQDATIEVGPLGECDEGYLFCDVSCEGQGESCCPSSVSTGQSITVPNPFRLEEPGAVGHRPVRASLMSGGECYGQDMQELHYFFLNPRLGNDVEGPDGDCVSCMFGIWMYVVDLLDECPSDCGSGGFLDFVCGFLDITGPSAFLAHPQGSTPTPDFLTTLRGLRDQIMATSAAGQRYTQLHTTHSAALMRVVPSRPWLVWMVGDALGAWLPALNALVTGQGMSVVISQQMMDDWLAILAELQAGAPPATAAVIQAELDRLDLPSFVGLTMDEARARFEERGIDGPPPSSCGDGFDGADCALAELLERDVCGTDAVDTKLAALLGKRVGKARSILGRAATSTKAGKTKKLVRKTAKQLAALQRKVRKANATSDACRATLDAMMESRRQQVSSLGG